MSSSSSVGINSFVLASQFCNCCDGCSASAEHTLSVSFGHDICLSFLTLSIADHPPVKLSRGNMHIYLILKIKNAI